MEFKKSLLMTQEDYVSFNLFFVCNRMIIAPVLFFVLLSLISFVLIKTRNIGWTLQFVIIGIFAFLAGMMTLINLFLLTNAAKKQYQLSRALQSDYTVIIDAGGIRQTGEFSARTALWLDIIKAAESKKAFYNFLFAD